MDQAANGFHADCPPASADLQVAHCPLVVAHRQHQQRTRAGTNVYATGANPTASRLSGINTNRTLIGVYMFSGFCAALASIFLSARMMTAMPLISASARRWTSLPRWSSRNTLTGGVGDIWGTVIGTLFLALIKNGILKLGLSPTSSRS